MKRISKDGTTLVLLRHIRRSGEIAETDSTGVRARNLSRPQGGAHASPRLKLR